MDYERNVMMGVEEVHARKLAPIPKMNQYNTIPRSSGSSNFFQGWTNYAGLRDAAEEDMDESMASSPAPSSSLDELTSPMTLSSFGGRSDETSSWPYRLGKVDSLGLSGIGSIYLKDGSLSPLPRSGSLLESVGEEAHDEPDKGGSDTAPGMFGMDLNSPLSLTVPGEDTDMLDIDMGLWSSCLSTSASARDL
jgi:hypothetical protein